MIVFLIILCIITVPTSLFALWAVWRLNKYISRLEDYIDEQCVTRVDSFEDALRTAIKEDYLKPNAKIKKPLMPKEDDM